MMNWQKVINIFIVIFIVINLIMIGINKEIDNRRYNLSNERKNQLSNILSIKGFSLYDHIPGFFPMKKIILNPPSVDKEKIAKAMFKDQEYVISFTANGEVYKTEDQEIEFMKGDKKGQIIYRGETGEYKPNSLESEEVKKTGKKFAEEITLSVPKLELTFIKQVDDFFILEFNEVYKGEILFCSYVHMKISANGVEEAVAIRYAPESFKGEEQKLYPIDEALYNFLSKVHPDEGERYYIKGIDIGYNLGTQGNELNILVEAVPYYRIKLDNGLTFYINAYTNELKDTDINGDF